MSLLRQQQQQLQLLPAVWPVQNTRLGNSGHLNGPRDTLDAELQMLQQARQRIQARLKMANLFQQYRAQQISNKYDITITSDPVSREEKICLTVYKNKKVVPLTVKNSGVTTVYLTFRTSNLVKNIFTVRDCHGNIIKTIKQHALGPGDSYRFKVHFYSRHGGFYEQLLVFIFETCQQSSDRFEIMRLLEVIRRTSFSEELPPTATNLLCNIKTTEWPSEGLMWLRTVVSLRAYKMPDRITKVRDSDRELERPLDWKNYSQRFHLLLFLEELHQKRERDKCIQYNVPIVKHSSNSNLFVLQIAGSKEIPFKLHGSQVLVIRLDQSGVPENEITKGWVCHVNGEQICLQLSERFVSRFEEGTSFNVEFALNRLPLRVQHRAVELACKDRLREVLFPTEQHFSRNSDLCSPKGLLGNPEQRTAIQHILGRSARPAPYLVFGPPGTGKTVTLVEAIRHIVNTKDSGNILACAPSNSATDHLCEKILKATKKVYRLYALTYPVRKIPQSVKSYCNLNRRTKTLMIPSRAELKRYKVMVTTLVNAGRLVTGGIPKRHYSYIFVDEAGQAAESECIIPIAGLIRPRISQVVLAGDPKQLGPVITAKMAEAHGLGVSLLERLMTTNNLYMPHETQGFNNCFVTKLLRNYRSHPAILKIPNELFYKGELQAYANKEQCTSYCEWEHLPKKGFPLIFHGVAGTDERDGNCPSVYNMAEVEVVKEYLKALLDRFRKKGVTNIEPREIGIIAPYRKQVEKIQTAFQTDKDLRKENLENILVGSVEQFQGKEFNVILISTVRSTPKLTAHEQRFTLGFVNNEKRFNVALTRARALLIVIGDPRVLKTDQMWNKFIHYCYTEGGYRGITVSEEEEEEEEDTPTDERSPNSYEE